VYYIILIKWESTIYNAQYKNLQYEYERFDPYADPLQHIKFGTIKKFSQSLFSRY